MTDDTQRDVLDGVEDQTNGTGNGPCCRWRSGIQVPLLLAAAAGLGFAGPQIWNNRLDLESMLTGRTTGQCTAALPDLATGCGHQESYLTAVADQDNGADGAAVSALTPANLTSTPETL